MASITALREGLATRLNTISGLRAAAYFPEGITPPVAIVGGPTVTYNADTMSDDYSFPVHLLVGEATDRGAQLALDAFCASSGASSVRTAIEGDETLGGVAQYALVTQLTDYGIQEVQSVRYFAATFTVLVVVYR